MPDFTRQIPDGDTRERLVCGTCGHIAYQNPKVIVGAVVAHAGPIVAVLLVLVLVASPTIYPPLALTLPGAPSTGAATGFVPAPMPDEDAPTPSGLLPKQSGPSVMPGLSRPGSGPTYQSGGFTPGSTYNNAQDNRFRPLPMLNLSVPLQ